MQEIKKQITPELINEKIGLLKEKFDADGQDLTVHLDGLYHSNYLKYWEYINLETLLSLQKPKTGFPDELIFIVYHQITELYFKMVLHEIKQLCEHTDLHTAFFLKRMKRINWYFGHLVQSFDVISVGMENEQFMKFRSALHPASGFQSVQYRMIEIMSTDFINLVSKDKRSEYTDYATIDQMYENIYWKSGSTDIQTKKPSLTLRMFEEQYSNKLIRLANKFKDINLYAIYKRLPTDFQSGEECINVLKQYDMIVNINWPLAHYKYAIRYLIKKDVALSATGGTNWQKYLPPKFQKQIFFPSLYSADEIENWGKSWVENELNNFSEYIKS
jgi:tryptophan 2,3-dioxygenase